MTSTQEVAAPPWARVPDGLYVGLAALLSVLFLLRLQVRPSCCDAAAYAASAADIVRDGLVSEWSKVDLRTYGYPLFLSWVQRAGAALALPPTGLVAVVQFAVFLAACRVLRDTLRQHWQAAGRLVYPLVLCNPLLLVHVPEMLTESLSISVAVLWLALAVRAYGPDRPGSWRVFAGLGLLAGTGQVIRPANLVLVVATVVLLVAVLARRGRQGATAGLGAAAAAAGAYLLPLLPQLRINHALFGRWTPLPVADLGDLQLRFGVQMVKYTTDLTVPGGRGAPYDNPFLAGPPAAGAVPANPLDYYLQEPLDGIRLLLLHVFNSVNPDFLFTYVYDQDPWYRVPLVLATHVLVFGGATGALGLLGRQGGDDRPGRVRRALLPCVLLVVLSAGLNALTAVETRFGVYTLLGLTLCAAHLPHLARRAPRRQRRVWLVALAGWLAASLWLTSWVLEQSPVLSG